MFEAIGGFSAEDLDRADPRYRRWVRGRLANGRAEAVLAWLDGAAIGSAVIWYREDQPRPSSSALRVPYLMSVYVDPAYRGRGIATRLTEFLVARARTRGFPRVLLHASRFGRSVYARLGFERTWEMRWGGPYRSLPEGPERRRGRTFQGPGRRRSPRGRLR
ncbi:MAG TPA: GNAT family N-acetyltransferase [Thermoplasmata archaeon]|nr:GNAT family N-acetyltransferase [Thermoplasmata archaeon]